MAAAVVAGGALVGGVLFTGATPASAATGGSVARVAAVAAPAARPSAASTFNFCNNTGPVRPIACFTARLRFIDAHHFALSSVVLTDRACDNRSSFATPISQDSAWIRGRISPALTPYYYKNALGCRRSVSFPATIFTSRTKIQFIGIALFAANRTGRSTIVLSQRHFNPFH